MPHNLVSAHPGQPGGSRSGKLGTYLCACGEVFPGNESFKAHRAKSLRAEAVERGARALMEFEVESYNWVYPHMENLSWFDLPESIQNKYRDRVSVVLDAAKVRKVQ